MLRLSIVLSDAGRISYYCTEMLGRSVRYGDLSYMLRDLTAAEREETDGLPLFESFVAWCNELREELGDDPSGMRAKYRLLTSKMRTGRDGTERVTLATGEYRAATIFNRSYAWVCAASATVDMMAARVNKAVDACRVNCEDASLRAQLDAARLDLEAANAYLKKADGFKRMWSTRKKQAKRERSTCETKTLANRVTDYPTLVLGLQRRCEKQRCEKLRGRFKRRSNYSSASGGVQPCMRITRHLQTKLTTRPTVCASVLAE